MEFDYALVRTLHVVGACALIGSGAVIVFFLFLANSTRSPKLIAHVARSVIVADWTFVGAGVLVQPVTGVLLALMLGWPLTEPWLVWSVILYVVGGAFLVPALWLQYLIRDEARAADAAGTELSPRYDRLFRFWMVSITPAFLSVFAILWLMVQRPALQWLRWTGVDEQIDRAFSGPAMAARVRERFHKALARLEGPSRPRY